MTAWLNDEETLTLAATDWGGTVHRKPRWVVRPADEDGIAAAFRYAAAHRIPIRARGQGHSLDGRAQADGGIVLDMRGWTGIRWSGTALIAEAGALWSEVLAATLPRGLTPPVLTDYLELSVGGTLSAGGIGGATQHYGLQTDNVLELDVLTPDGRSHTCSAAREPELFDAVRAGGGRHGVILRATLRLVPARTSTTRYKLHYRDLPAFLVDQRRLLAEGRFDHLVGQAVPDGGGWRYFIEAARHRGGDSSGGDLLGGDPRDADRDTAGLSWHEREVEHGPHFEFLNQMAPNVALLREIGHWYRPHPWLNLLLPDSGARASITGTLAALTTTGLGETGLSLIYPFHTGKIRTPGVVLPAEPTAFLFALLPTATSADDAHDLHRANREVLRRAESAGATCYRI